MRWSSLAFFLTVLPSFGGTPTESVLAVLDSLKSENRQPGVPEEVAISGFAGPKTRASLNEAWNERAEWVRSERVEFFKGYEKIDGDLSAVLIGARSADNPSEVEMMAFCARLENEKWLIGPVEGRFDSMGLGFGKPLRDKARNLEQWLASERVMAADRLKKDAMARFKEKMAKVVDADLLKKATPRQVMENFLAAAKANRVDELLVWQGILERDDHDEIPWDELIYITRQGMKNQDARNVWRVLNRPGVMRVLLDGEEDDEEKSMLVSFLAGFKTGRDHKKLRPVIFKIRNSPAGWRIDLPAYFAKANEDEWDHWKAHQREVHFRDEVNTERMASIFEDENPAQRSKTPEQLLDRVVKDLFEGEFQRTLPYLYRDAPVEEEPVEEAEKEVEEELEEEEVAEEEIIDIEEVLVQEDDEDPELEKVLRYQQMAVWWSNVSGNKKGIRVGARKVSLSGDLALGILEIQPSDGGWMPEYHSLWMAKDEDGWMILPGAEKSLTGMVKDEQKEDQQKLSGQIQGMKDKLQEQFFVTLFKSVSLMEVGKNTVSEADGVELAKEWRKLVVGGDISKILTLSGVRKTPENFDDILQNLSFRIKGAAVAQVPDKILGSHAEGRLRGVSIMVDGGRGISMDCPLLIIAPTKEGPRLLIDTEIYLGTNRGKELRNGNELEKLEKEMNKEDFESFKKLVKWHEKTARPAWDEWNGAVKAQQRK